MARLDAELVSRGIARSRQRAKEMIQAGSISVNGSSITKASAEVSPDDVIESSEEELYVGRGAPARAYRRHAHRLARRRHATSRDQPTRQHAERRRAANRAYESSSFHFRYLRTLNLKTSKLRNHETSKPLYRM